MKHIGKFPIGVIGIIDRKLFDVKKKIYMEYNFFIFFAKRLLKFIEYSIWDLIISRRRKF